MSVLSHVRLNEARREDFNVTTYRWDKGRGPVYSNLTGQRYAVTLISIKQILGRPADFEAWGWRIRQDGTLGTHKYAKLIYLSQDAARQLLALHREAS